MIKNGLLTVLHLLISFAFVVVAVSCSEGNKIVTESDIKYGEALNDTGAVQPLLMDLYASKQKTRGAKPAMILVHGGGFSSGDKRLGLYDTMAREFAKNGYVVFSVDYRLRTAGYTQTVVDNTVTDVLMALGFIKRNSSRYGVDTTKIFIGGDSAGGVAAVHAAYKDPASSQFAGCIDLWGGQSPVTQSVNDGPAWDQPIFPHPVPENAPPTCIIQGSADVTVPQQVSVGFAQQLNEAGIYNELHIIEGAPHYATEYTDRFIPMMLSFTNRIVSGRLTSGEVYVTTFGADGTDEDLDTEAFQHAIDYCHGIGGGVVNVPEGEYYIGTIELRSNVTLGLEKGSFLYGSKSIDDYRRDVETAVEIPSSSACLIYANAAENCGISGSGVIDLRGDTLSFPYADSTGKHSTRPMGLRFVKCRDVEISGITLKDAAAWMSHFVQCENVKIEGITINNRVNHNNDGIDLDNCKHVEISDCHISSGDDAICLKSTQGTANENIHIHDCKISSRWGCFKTGTSSSGGFKNITVENCEFYDCEGIAIKLICVDGGIMEGITISNIHMKRVTGPLFMRLGGRYRSYEKAEEMAYNKSEAEGEGRSVIRNVTIEDIDAEVVTDDLLISNIMITGYPGHDIENISLKNITVEYPGGGTKEHAQTEVPENVAGYPEMSFFGMLPASGIYLRHIDGLAIDNCNISYRSSDARPVLVADDVKRVRIDGLNINGLSGTEKLFDLSGSDAGEIELNRIELNNKAVNITTTDIYGNHWELRSDKNSLDMVVSVRSFDHKSTPVNLRKNDVLPAGDWSMILADQFGFVWVGGKEGLLYLDPRNEERGWNHFVTDDHYPGGEVVEMECCFNGHVVVKTENGNAFQVDVNSKGQQLALAQKEGDCEANGPWKQRTPMPYGAHDVFGAVLHGRIYIPGGAATHGYPINTHYNFDRMLVYDTGSDSWEVTSPMKTDRRYCNVGMLDEKIWVVGGYHKADSKETATNTIEIYDPVNGTWKEGPSLDIPVAESVTGVILNRLYLVVKSPDETGSLTYSIASGETEWREETPLPYVVTQTDGAVYNEKLYVVIPEVGLVLYDPVSRRWKTDLKSFPDNQVPRAAAVATYKDKIWVISGTDIEDTKAVWIYSPDSDQWEEGPSFPKPTFWADGCEVNGSLFVFGGATYDDLHNRFVFWNTVYEYKEGNQKN